MLQLKQEGSLMMAFQVAIPKHVSSKSLENTMSTFCGKIEEITGISVDRFDNENLQSEVFFLSHCHSDHMKGLQAKYFEETLKSRDRFLYLSPVSKAILRRMYPGLTSRLKELSLEGNTSILVKDKTISVRLIPAGHCPGSVMFLFETSEGKRVLYTGDYRVSSSDIPKFNCFYDSFYQVKEIDAVYLDTTFFLECYKSFPKRDQSLTEVCRIIDSWLAQNEKHCVKINTSAKYGYEYIFKEIYERSKMPVHVNEEIFKFYSLIPELDETVTKSGEKTRIHSCYLGPRTQCEHIDYKHVKNIKISAFRWQNKDLKHGLSYYENNTHFVCYSTHASYEEGLALLDFLRPKKIVACVEHENDPVSTQKMFKLIQGKIEEYNKVENVEEVAAGPKLFKIKENTGPTKKRKKIVQVDPIDAHFFDSL